MHIYVVVLSVKVTFIEALDQLMPGFDPEIGKLAQRVLINPRKIDYHTGVFATKVTCGLCSTIWVFPGFLAFIFFGYILFIDNTSKGWEASHY